MLSAEGIMGYWDGTPTKSPLPGAGSGWPAFSRLQGDARLAVLQHEMAPLFRVAASGADLSVILPVGATADLLTLTPPVIAQLAVQLAHVRAAADLRPDRLGEISAQMGDMMSFYGSLFRLHPDARRWTRILLAAAYEAVLIPEMRLKFHTSLPRPFDFAPEVQPVITTPAHSTYPSGHATEAFAFATVLHGVRRAAEGAADPVAAVMADLLAANAATSSALLPFRLAARIADNRTVAGVHFPVDSAHGALLGLSCGLAVLAMCQTAPTKVPTWVADAADWVSDFTLDAWCASLPVWKTASQATMPAAATTDLPAMLFAHAVAEWA